MRAPAARPQTDPGSDARSSAMEASTSLISDKRFAEIYQTECDYVWHNLRRLGVRSGDIEPIAHEVFLTLFRRSHELDLERPLRPWLFGTALRMARDYRRSAQRRHIASSDAFDEFVDEVPGADERLDIERRRRLVHRALDALDLDKRAVMILHDLEGSPIPEVATALQIPLNTAYSRLRLARQEFAVAVRRIELQKRANPPKVPIGARGTR
ncbi:MAG: hypothetical protein NVSMB1_09930 [Polyangiales bacterium]